jgi:hypothetical protein
MSTRGLSADERTALEMLAEQGGEWTKTSGWHVGTVARTVKLMDALVAAGLAAKMGAVRYSITVTGLRATADHMASLPDNFES